MSVVVKRKKGDKVDEYRLDFCPLLTPHVKFAVSLASEEEASVLISALKIAYPTKCPDIWKRDEPVWSDAYAKTQGGIVYYPDVNNMDGSILRWGGMRSAKEHGVTIIPFSELLCAAAEPLNEGSQNISELFDLFQIQ